MDKAITVLIGLGLFGIFGSIINNVIYYLLFIFRLIFDFLYFVGNIFDMSILGKTIINLLFYFIIIIIFKGMYNLIIKT